MGYRGRSASEGREGVKGARIRSFLEGIPAPKTGVKGVRDVLGVEI